MNLRQIEVFHAVYTNGSVTRAARVLNVSQPSVSRVLKHTETILGFPLFRRAKGRLTATEEAETLFRTVDDIYSRVGSLKEAAKNIQRGHDKEIRLAVLPGFGLGVAPMAVARFRAMHPTVRFDIQTLHHDDILRTLHERDCDLAIGYDAPIHPRLTHTEIGRSQLVLLFRRGHLDPPVEGASLRLLEGKDFVSFGESGPIGVLFAREAQHLGLDLREVAHVRTFYVAAALVRFGAGLGVVDEFTAHACMAPELDFRPLDPPISFGVYCTHLDDRPISRLTRGFVKVLAEVMAETRAS